MARNLVTVRYVGPHPEIEFDPDGLGLTSLVRGETIDVPEETASSLLEQPANWQTVKTTANAPKSAPTAEEAK